MRPMDAPPLTITRDNPSGVTACPPSVAATAGGAISLPRRLSYSEARDRVADVGLRVEAYQARYDATRSHKAQVDLTNAVTALMRAQNALRRLENSK